MTDQNSVEIYSCSLEIIISPLQRLAVRMNNDDSLRRIYGYGRPDELKLDNKKPLTVGIFLMMCNESLARLSRQLALSIIFNWAGLLSITIWSTLYRFQVFNL